MSKEELIASFRSELRKWLFEFEHRVKKTTDDLKGFERPFRDLRGRALVLKLNWLEECNLARQALAALQEKEG